MKTASREEIFSMNLSLATGVLMLALKWAAYFITGSAAAFSDALETVVHVAAVMFAAYSLRVVYRPPDSNHHFGLIWSIIAKSYNKLFTKRTQIFLYFRNWRLRVIFLHPKKI